MKKIVVAVCFVLVVLLVVVGGQKSPQKQEYIRIHIRANSNQEIDQNIKYEIKDCIVKYLTPYIASCQTKQDFEKIITKNLCNVENIANEILAQKGFLYKSNAKFCQENFPARSYNNFVLESGIYDALILELGEANGDNWWCVVYPPLCFVENNQDILYKSKILEILKSIINGNK